MSRNNPRKNIDMSKWIRGIYNATANFNMSNALRSASGRVLGGNSKHMREESVKSNKCEQSCQSCESDKSSQHASACHRNRATVCSNGTHCRVNACGNPRPINTNKTGNVAVHGDNCSCSLCRDYNDYANASIRTEGQGAGARIRVSNEPRTFKQSNSNATSSVERVTGIPTGVTI